jgi:outer membrane protein
VKLSKLAVFSMVIMLVLFVGTNRGFAQLKIRYINSQKILEDYPEWVEAQKQLDELKGTYEKDFTKMQEEAKTLVEDIKNQSLLLSPEKKAEKEAKLQNLQIQMEQFYYQKLGPQGELFRKGQELSEPIVDKINQVIKQVGEDEGYDFILDAAQGQLLYAKEEFDITAKVLEQLNKTQ